MDRKGILIIIVTLGIALGYHFFIGKPKQEAAYKAWKEQQEKIKATTPATPDATAQTNPAATPTTPVVPAQPDVPAEMKTLTSNPGTVDYVFTNLGGGISRVVLKGHYENKEKGTLIVLNEFGSIPIGAIAETPGEGTNLPWTMTSDDANGVVSFERTDTARQIKVVKKFTLPKKFAEDEKRRDKLREEYLIDLEVTYTNLGPGPMMVPKYFLHTGGAAIINTREQPLYQGFDWWRDGQNNFKDVNYFSAGGMLFWSHPERLVFRQDGDLMRWSAVTNQYFTTMVTVLGAEGKTEEDQRPLLGVTAWAKRSDISADEWRKVTPWRPFGHEVKANAKLYQVDGALGVPEFALTAGQFTTRNYQIYAGPREYRRLRLLDHHQSDVLDYGSFLGVIPTGAFSRLLLNSMNALYAWLGSYAFAIILLTVIVKALLWPLQNKANKSMKKMAVVQPELKKLQDKYKDDPVRFQKEMGQLWKKHGVNPLSGCWPIFIQIPIFIGFYQMLGKAVELRDHGFLWVKDLASPDTVAHIFGLPINPLPLLMAGTMFLQMSLSPKTGDPAQRKMFMFMPLIFIFMCYNFASALALYWSVQNIISIVQLLLNRNKKDAPQQLAVA
jgi:YidC/Oxa1 family membrane protein insertase